MAGNIFCSRINKLEMSLGEWWSRPNELAFAPFFFPKGIERSEHTDLSQLNSKLRHIRN
jgi:hypothetical protein